MQIKISNTFSYFGYAELIFDKNGLIKHDHTNLQYDNIWAVFNSLTGGIGTRSKEIDTPFVKEWDAILANVEWYSQIGEDGQNRLFGTYRGNPDVDDWAEFQPAPSVHIIY